jgi:hypothetical protein
MRQIGRTQPDERYLPEASSGTGRSQIHAMQRLYLRRGVDLHGANTGQFSGICISDMQTQLGI